MGAGWERGGGVSAGGGEGSCLVPRPVWQGSSSRMKGTSPEADQHCSGPGLASGLWLSSWPHCATPNPHPQLRVCDMSLG